MGKGLILLSFFITNLVIAQETPPFANITSIEYRGTGCDAESASVAITPDLNYFSILYDRFSLEIGQGTLLPTTKIAQKRCDIIVKFDLPAGWSLQFDSVEYRGFVALPNQHSTAKQVISVETLGGKGRNFQENTLQGPLMDNFVIVYNNDIENISNPNAAHKKLKEEADSKPKHQSQNKDNHNHKDSHQDKRRNEDRAGAGAGAGDKEKRRRHIRSGDFFECSERAQQGILRIKSRILIKNTGDKDHALTQFVVDSTDASFTQKLKINWNKCLDN